MSNLIQEIFAGKPTGTLIGHPDNGMIYHSSKQWNCPRTAVRERRSEWTCLEAMPENDTCLYWELKQAFALLPKHVRDLSMGEYLVLDEWHSELSPLDEVAIRAEWQQRRDDAVKAREELSQFLENKK